MDDDRPKNYPLSASKMSKTPSWVMLGFVLGALFIFLFFPRKEKVPATPFDSPAPAAEEVAKASAPSDPPMLSRIEAVFDEWGKYATWSGDTTEVALWDIAKERYSEFYEVRKIEGNFYFRTLPALTRRIAHGKPPLECPLQFTETEEQYREWYDNGRTERPVERMWQKPPPPPRATPSGVKPTVPETQRVVPSLDAPVVPRPPPTGK